MDTTGVVRALILTSREFQVDRSQVEKPVGEGSSKKCEWSGLVGA